MAMSTWYRRCGTYNGQIRCLEPAVYKLQAPDGWLDYYGICERHGTAVVEEYRTKLGWVWSLIPLTP